MYTSVGIIGSNVIQPSVYKQVLQCLSPHVVLLCSFLASKYCQYVYSNCLALLSLGVATIGVRTCASLLRLNSIVGCSKNTLIVSFVHCSVF